MPVFRSCGQFEPMRKRYLGHMTTFWLLQELKKLKSLFVCLMISESRAVNLHLSGSGLSQASLRSEVFLSSFSRFFSALLDYLIGQTEPKILGLVTNEGPVVTCMSPSSC